MARPRRIQSLVGIGRSPGGGRNWAKSKLDSRRDEVPGVDPPALIDAASGGQLWRSEEPRRIANRDDIARHVRSLPAQCRQSLLALYLGRDFELLATEKLGAGNVGECRVKPMRIISQAHRLGAIGFVLVHDDPARASVPTAEEIRATREIRRLGEDFSIFLLDCIILGQDRMRDIAA